MKRILVTGALGQIGSELVVSLRERYGDENVIATDIRMPGDVQLRDSGPFEFMDCLDPHHITRVMQIYNADTIYHLAAILSAVGETKPNQAWQVNVHGLYNILEAARQYHCSLFVPSSIGAFGKDTPKDKTPQVTIQRPDTMYGVTKVTGELLCDYYHKRFGLDTRGVRFPGLISYETEPGGGTTDYAVEIYIEALKYKKYTCYLEENTYLDMMYMPDAIKAMINLMEADPNKLIHRNSFNVTAMNFTPGQIAAEIKKHIPDFDIEYKVDPVRQAIADSWPNSLDDSCAREEWGWDPIYDLESMTKDMLEKLAERIELPAEQKSR
ncbi:MAG: L-threonine 3-dehydrogenase [candidate division Zixibacteria bacterium]|nr:L-threonine 3-dehydrogenase [candidate division Zixibacteria bacterium]NIR64744.1 L-threonine 3-dehydrogenase [candidate division Zixibacteria bacterium]NIS17187.1 L-threonine 3-dehydrogenase [candidate division Zixibacteria bacterium]NIS46574.1 L-threonine 3-dehydrogenase [candidate division Zixibacteria bacterium]NIT53540.1 L-threonine 3-dehydrogenase [candidate division Zixibacteria bacterium]